MVYRTAAQNQNVALPTRVQGMLGGGTGGMFGSLA
jgi:hypothetical protein